MRVGPAFACVLLMLGPAAPLAGQAAKQDYAQSYHEPFKGPPQQADDITLFGPDAAACVKFEPEGLRITFPAGKTRAPTGVATAFGATGDFEITVRYEVLEEPERANAGTPTTGTRLSLTVNLDTPEVNDASMRRKVTPNQEPHILVYRTLRKDADSPPENLGQVFPVTEKTGRLRMVRTGADLAYYLAEGRDEEFTLLTTQPFSTADLKDVRLYGQTSSPNAALDLRFSDLHIKAASLPRKPATRKIEAVRETQIPTKDYAQTYRQSFQASTVRPAGWAFTSRISEQCVQFEPAGLHITLPVGEARGAGVVSEFGVKGDFEITLSFEILQEPEPADVGKTGTRFSLAVALDTPNLDTPKSEVATLSYSMANKRFVTWARPRDRATPVSHGFPAPAATGRLRLLRSGEDLFFLASAGGEQPFLFLKKYHFGADDLKRITITGATGGENAVLEARVTDFLVRADAIPGVGEPAVDQPGPPRAGGRGALFALLRIGLALALVGFIAIAIWFRASKGRR